MTEQNVIDKPEGYFTCPVRRTLSVVGGKWKLLIINELLVSPLRFNELKRRVGKISQRLLTAQLRALEEDGIVTREVKNIMPPHVEYKLTTQGQSISEVIEVLTIWGAKAIEQDTQQQ